MSRIFSLAIALIALLAFTTSTYAFDGNRQGFILGAGIGPGLTSYTFNGLGARTNKFSLITDFKIGYAPNNQLLIYWMSKVAWYSEKVLTGSLKSVTIINGVAGLGISYYFEEEGPSPYLTGGVGYSSLGAPFESDLESDYGLGIAAGAGYEFAKHWSVEGVFTWGNPGDVIKMNTIGLKVTINGLAY